jgi:hypothetical protein
LVGFFLFCFLFVFVSSSSWASQSKLPRPLQGSHPQTWGNNGWEEDGKQGIWTEQDQRLEVLAPRYPRRINTREEGKR